MSRAFFALLVSFWLVAPALAQTRARRPDAPLYPAIGGARPATDGPERGSGAPGERAARAARHGGAAGRARTDRGRDTGAGRRRYGCHGRLRGFAARRAAADLGTLSVAPNGEAAPAAESSANNRGAPIDLSTLAGGSPSPLAVPGVSESAPAGQNSGAPETQTAVVAPPSVPAATTALSAARRATNTTLPTAIS